MNSQMLRQQIVSEIAALLQRALLERAPFIDYLRYKFASERLDEPHSGMFSKPSSAAELEEPLSERLPPEALSQACWELLPGCTVIYPAWETLVVSYGVVGVNVHDARPVAAMQVHGLMHILTFNLSDFRRYAGITAIAPAEV